jgi:hypothetical protein
MIGPAPTVRPCRDRGIFGDTSPHRRHLPIMRLHLRPSARGRACSRTVPLRSRHPQVRRRVAPASSGRLQVAADPETLISDTGPTELVSNVAGMRRHQKKALCINHRYSPLSSIAAVRDRSDRLLHDDQTVVACQSLVYHSINCCANARLRVSACAVSLSSRCCNSTSAKMGRYLRSCGPLTPQVTSSLPACARLFFGKAHRVRLTSIGS